MVGSPLEVFRVRVPTGLQGVNFDMRQPGGFFSRYPRPFFGEAMRAKWETWRVFTTNPVAQRADFFSFLDGIGLRPSASERVRPLLEPWGEFLPIEIENEGTCEVFNCTHISPNAVDLTRSQKLTGRKLGEAPKFVFRADAVRKLSIFKVPESLGWTLLVRGGDRPPDQDFYVAYQNAKLTGLNFEKLWTEELWR